MSASADSSRKARSAEPDLAARDNGLVKRASISMPPPASTAMHRYSHSRRASKASDIVASSSTLHPDSAAIHGQGESPVLEAKDPLHGHPTALQQYLKPSEGDTESNRMSFSSLYSLGSVVYSGARALTTSYPSSIAGSEMDAGEPNVAWSSGLLLTVCSQARRTQPCGNCNLTHIGNDRQFTYGSTADAANTDSSRGHLSSFTPNWSYVESKLSPFAPCSLHNAARGTLAQSNKSSAENQWQYRRT